MIRKADIILTTALIIVGLGLSYFFTMGSDIGSEVVISINKEKVAEYSLLEDRTVVISDSKINPAGNGGVNKKSEYNIIKIEDGKVTVPEANCRGKDCTRQGPISGTGETIVCLPHKVMIEITGGDKKYDTVSK